VEGTQTIEGAPHVKAEHLPIFDCANQCGRGKRFIDPMAHIKIMAATQPFLSGAISKTVNLPNNATVEDIKNIYIEAWKLGLKCVALYRDGSKFSQPLNNAKSTDTEEALAEEGVPTLRWGSKRELPKKRNGFTLESSVSGHKIHVRTGEFEDGTLGEIFIDMFKEGAAYRSMVNCFAIAVSLGLQYGVPLEKFVDSFTFTRFEPSGMTDHPNVKQCTSVVDFIFRVIGMEYLGRTDFVQVPPADRMTIREEAPVQRQLPIAKPETTHTPKVVDTELSSALLRTEQLKSMMGDAPFCSNCGSITIRNGACYKCDNCGNSEGCS